MPEPIHVAVGVIPGADRRILIARRPPDVHQGDLWEFPGGKLEAGESVLAALRRELREELDIEIDRTRCFPLKKIFYRYGERSVLLDVWRVDRYRGTPRGRENQPLAWRLPEQLDPEEFPAANREIIRLLQLPALLAITGSCESRSQFEQKFRDLLASGIRLIQFRQAGLSVQATRHWLAELLPLCEQHQARLLVNAAPEDYPGIPAHGLHVNSARLMALNERPVPASGLFSASCHNAVELARAERLGVDFALLSPVLDTASHPGAATLGWEGFRALAAQYSIPVYALGGLTPDDLAMAQDAGAHGVAALGAFW